MRRGLLTFLGTGSDRLPGPRPTFFRRRSPSRARMAIAQIPEGVRFAAATASNSPSACGVLGERFVGQGVAALDERSLALGRPGGSLRNVGSRLASPAVPRTISAGTWRSWRNGKRAAANRDSRSARSRRRRHGAAAASAVAITSSRSRCSSARTSRAHRRADPRRPHCVANATRMSRTISSP